MQDPSANYCSDACMASTRDNFRVGCGCPIELKKLIEAKEKRELRAIATWVQTSHPASSKPRV